MTRTDEVELFAPDDGPAPEAGVAEVPLLLPAGQAAALEGEAHRLGLTAAQVLRGLVRDFLRQRRSA